MTAGRWVLIVVFLAWSGFAAAQADPKFEIRRFIVEGNTLLPAAEVERLVGPFAGPSRDFGDVQQALEALQEAYLSRGYNAVRVLVPEQELRGGEVRLRVVEARVRQVRVENNRFFNADNVRAGVPALKAGEAPNTRRIGENVQLVNENPAKQVGVRLEATDQPGQVDASIRVVDYDPSKITISLDNTGNSSTGQARLGLGYQNANVGNDDHVFTVQAIASPTEVKKLAIFGVGYRIPVYSWGGMFDFVAGYSDVDSGQVADLFNVSGSGSIAGARYTQILSRVEAYEQKVSLGFDYREFKQNVAVIGTTQTLVPDVTVHPLSVGYNGRYSQVGTDLSFFVAYAQNIPGGPDGEQDDITAQRAGSPARYDVWRFGGVWSQGLGDFLIRAGLNAQYTNNPLIPGEQFGLGGANSVRGFYEREVANDNGYTATLEFYGPDLGAHFGPDWRARFLVFTDVGKGSDVAPVRSAENGLGSVGAGIRLNYSRSLVLRLDWANVVNAGGTRDKGKDRVHFGGSYSF